MAGNSKGGGIKQLLLAHCEKVIAAALVGLAAYFMYASTSIEGTERNASDLTTLVSSTSAAIEQQTWTDVPAENKLIAYEVPSPAIGEDPQLAKSLVAPGEGITRPVMPQIVDRSDPQLLAATDLDGTAITAIFAFESEEVRRQRIIEARRLEQKKKKEAEEAREAGRDGELLGGGRGFEQGEEGVDEQGRKVRPVPGQVAKLGVPTQGDELFATFSVACVTAKAPIIDQLNVYKAALSDARGYDPGSDIPDYVGLIAERAEVRDDDAEPVWEVVRFGNVAEGTPNQPALSEKILLKTTEDWIPYPLPLVDSRYEHPILTMELAPLVQQSWGRDTVHPDAPLQSETDALEAAQEAEGDPEEVEDDPDAGIFARSGDAGGRRGGRRGGRGFGGEFGGGGRGGFGGGEFGGGEFGGEFGGGGRGGFGGGEFGGGGGRGGRGSSAGTYQIDEDVPFVMVRFWDFTVEPGRQYRYRVKLVLTDVNADPTMKPYLSPEAGKRVAAKPRPTAPMMTEWSEPGTVISVPLAGDAFVSKAKLTGRQENVTLLVQAYSLNEDRRAIKAAVEKEFIRGDVLNFEEDVEVVKPDGRFIVEIEDFEFRTGLTVADFRGGEELPGRLEAPAKVLMMDAGGRLFMKDQLSDRETIEQHRNTFEESADGVNNFPGGGGGFGGRGEFGF